MQPGRVEFDNRQPLANQATIRKKHTAPASFPNTVRAHLIFNAFSETGNGNHVPARRDTPAFRMFPLHLAWNMHICSQNDTTKTSNQCSGGGRPTGGLGCAHQSFVPCRSQGACRTRLYCSVCFNSRRCGSGWLRHLPAGNPGGPDEGNDWKSIRASNRCLGSNLERRRIRGHPGPSLPGAAPPIPLAALNRKDRL